MILSPSRIRSPETLQISRALPRFTDCVVLSRVYGANPAYTAIKQGRKSSMIGTQTGNGDWFRQNFRIFQNFSEFRHGNHGKIHHSHPASFRPPEYWFISFCGNSENSEILSTWLPLIEKNGSLLIA
jgi:hypothetical protein